MRAALELFTEDGFEQTTVSGIAERAGVTERTFFRHFTDKREVLFDGSNGLRERVTDAIASTPGTLAPLPTVVAAFEVATPWLEERREFAGRRAAAIAANTSLQERELLKLASLASACTDALRKRGVADPTAMLAAETGVALFKIAFERWVAAGATGDLALHIREAAAELRTLVAEA
ncbi:transcriptional regulator, TetR family [Cryptosporangium aurantiacum]|uniref:Transcriptional regulator, TetR family n=2 Tax=Cryptosporangium aurantiacum TaxID=134849 RepID=A0A1M7MEP3_9ACTN|nr:transcriptional regulator, TetR family [Cryptosporangium aurantiacum]